MSLSPNGIAQCDEAAGTSSTAGKRKRHQSTDRFPWFNQDKKYSQGTTGLGEEIEDYFEWITATPKEHKCRVGVVKTIETVVKNRWGSAQVEIFGSFATGMFLPDGDIDLVVLGKWSVPPLWTLHYALMDNKVSELGQSEVLSNASVKIVKLKDQTTGIDVDISFNSSNGKKSAEYVCLYKRKYPTLHRLVLILKQLLGLHDLNVVYQKGGLSSYSLILMTISFLQLHPRQEEARSLNHLGSLLLDFLEFYGPKFSCDTKIELSGNGRHVTQDKNRPMVVKKGKSYRPSRMTIIDPVDGISDVCSGSHQIEKVKECFTEARKILLTAVHFGEKISDDQTVHSMLGSIVQIDDNVVEFRQKLEALQHVPDVSSTDSDAPVQISNEETGTNEIIQEAPPQKWTEGMCSYFDFQRKEIQIVDVENIDVKKCHSENMERIPVESDWSCSADLEKESERQAPPRHNHSSQKNKRRDNKPDPRLYLTYPASSRLTFGELQNVKRPIIEANRLVFIEFKSVKKGKTLIEFSGIGTIAAHASFKQKLAEKGIHTTFH